MIVVSPCWLNSCLLVQLFISVTFDGAVFFSDYYVQATRWRREQVSGKAV
jgi:hypothetical protein